MLCSKKERPQMNDVRVLLILYLSLCFRSRRDIGRELQADRELCQKSLSRENNDSQEGLEKQGSIGPT